MIVADPPNHRIVRWMHKEKDGLVIAGGRGPGDGLEQLHGPRGLCFDVETRDLYVADTDNHRVMRWAWDAQVGEVVCGGNGIGAGLHQLKYPHTLVMDSVGYLYIADVKNHRVLRWKPGDPEGEVVAGGLGVGSKLSQLNWPFGIALDADGVLHISDHLKDRVVRWPVGATQGEVVAGRGGKGINPDQLDAPCGITFDPHNRLLITDAGNHRIMRHARNVQGDLVRDAELVAGGEISGDGTQCLSWPHAVAVGSGGQLLITDVFNNRIVEWWPGSKEGSVRAGCDDVDCDPTKA